MSEFDLDTGKVRELSADFIVLRDLVNDIKIMETRLAEAADIDNAECLRDCADALQAVREHYWPLWMREVYRQAEREREKGGTAG